MLAWLFNSHSYGKYKSGRPLEDGTTMEMMEDVKSNDVCTW